MHNELLGLVANATQGADNGWKPEVTAAALRTALLAFIGCGLALASLWGLFLYAGKGRMSRAAAMVGTCLICLIPAAIAAPIALGVNILAWAGF